MSIAEKYARATGASSLTLEDHETALDVIIASGWTHSKMGVHLRRLQSEWDNAAKPLNTTPKARRQAIRALRSWRESVNMVSEWCRRRDVPERAGVVALAQWVDDTCTRCFGRGYEAIPGTPTLSATPCAHCNGTGRTRAPDECLPALDMFAACIGADTTFMRHALD